MIVEKKQAAQQRKKEDKDIPVNFYFVFECQIKAKDLKEQKKPWKNTCHGAIPFDPWPRSTIACGKGEVNDLYSVRTDRKC